MTRDEVHTKIQLMADLLFYQKKYEEFQLWTFENLDKLSITELEQVKQANWRYYFKIELLKKELEQYD